MSKIQDLQKMQALLNKDGISTKDHVAAAPLQRVKFILAISIFYLPGPHNQVFCFFLTNTA